MPSHLVRSQGVSWAAKPPPRPDPVPRHYGILDRTRPIRGILRQRSNPPHFAGSDGPSHAVVAASSHSPNTGTREGMYDWSRRQWPTAFCPLCGTGIGVVLCEACAGEGTYTTEPGRAGVSGVVGVAKCKVCMGEGIMPCRLCAPPGATIQVKLNKLKKAKAELKQRAKDGLEH
eukprot:jgi/Mesvir1/27062/Mv20754-RA.1